MVPWLSLCLGGMVSAGLHAETGATIDPTKPPSEVLANTLGGDAAHSDNVVLSGIKQDGKASFAILNDTFVRVGEVYKGYKLRAVHPDHVILEDESGQKLKLSMQLVNFKKSTTNGRPSGKSSMRTSKNSKTQNQSSTKN